MPDFVILLTLTLSGLIILFLAYRSVMASRQFSQIKSKFLITEEKLAAAVEKERVLNQELQGLKIQIENNITYDALTGLPSRRLFDDRITQTLIQSKRHHLIFSVLFLNIDGLKVINDALGLDAGDTLLKEVATRLPSSIRRMDTMSRFAGDTFVFLLPQLAKPEMAAYIAQRLLDDIAQPFQINGQDIFITASIGIAIYPNDSDEVASLLKNADYALYQAKIRGRNNYQFYRKEMGGVSQRTLVLTAGLRSPSVYQHFLIYYQPWVDINTKKIVCMEASLVWKHADFGLVPLRDFLRIAEDGGSIITMGEWLLRNACEQFQKWKSQAFYPENLAINISIRQLENSHFSYKLSLILQELNLTPANLILEISEWMLLKKSDTVEKNLNILNRLGIQIGINDFGAGNIALQQLRSFPLSYLKMTNALVKDITIDKESVAIVNMIIVLAKTLQLKVVADGVESQKQKQVLNELGCYLMQGDVFSRPILAEEFTLLLEGAIAESV